VFMCRMLRVSRQGFYQWRDRPPSQRQIDDAALTERIRKIHVGHGGRVGVRRVHDELRRAGVACSHKRVHRLMRAAGLRGVHPRPYKRTTLPDRFDPRLADLVARDFAPPAPNLTWVGDVTYIKTWAGWAFCATVIDCYSRKVVGFALADHMRTDLIIDALRMAIIHRDPPPGVIFTPTGEPSIRAPSSVTSAGITGFDPRSGVPGSVTITRSPNRFLRPSRKNSSTPGHGRLLTSSARLCSNISSRTIIVGAAIQQSAMAPRSSTSKGTHSYGYKPRNRVSSRSGTLHMAATVLSRHSVSLIPMI
jgi:transposase InsO family protein